MKTKSITNIHANHRNRVKKKFIESGLSSFADHEILELLLFYSIPQADTNKTAHNLINCFGSFNSVLEANIKDLTRIAGVGENSATLIKLCHAITRKYNLGNPKRRLLLNTQLEAMNFVSTQLKNLQTESFMVICLDSENGIIDTKEMSCGTSNKVMVNIREVTDYIIRNNCTRIIIAHNHPSGSPEPSNEDVLVTQRLVNSCMLNDIDIIDHIIYSPENLYSFTETGVLSLIKRTILNLLKFVIDKDKHDQLCAPSPNYQIIPRNISFKPVEIKFD